MQEITIDNNKQPKVNSICCYVCGRLFGTRGFTFHYKECLVKFNHQQQIKSLTDRIKLPEPPFQLEHILNGHLSKIDLKKFNQQANSLFKYKVLPSCRYCKRTFNADSLAVHIKGCPKKPTGYQQKQNLTLSTSKTPRVLVCCVCGQRFGTSSLRIHYPECIKKFKNEQFRKHKKQSDRLQPPQFSKEDVEALFKAEWTDQQLKQFNQRAMQNYRSNGMSECDNCGRKFFFEQLDKHRKNCEMINGKLRKGMVKPKDERVLKIAKPKVVTCIVCGRQYGTTSIVIHIGQCQILFKKQQALKTISERKKIPQLSEELKMQYPLSKIQEWTRQKLQEYNRIVFQIYNNKSLSKCYICHRTFFEESLPKHLKDCELKLKDVKKLQRFKKHVQSNKNLFGDNFIQNVMDINRQLSTKLIKDVKKPRVLMCPLCGRQYGTTSLNIHIPRCRGQTKVGQSQRSQLVDSIRLKYNISEAQNWKDDQIEEYNNEIRQIYKQKSLFECQYCHRTFFEQSLKKHIKHCQKNHGKKRGLKRSQTMGQIFPVEVQLLQGEQGPEIQLLKKQSEPIILQQNQDQQSNNSKEECYHALNYGDFIDEEEASNDSVTSMDIQTELMRAEEQPIQALNVPPTLQIQDFNDL